MADRAQALDLLCERVAQTHAELPDGAWPYYAYPATGTWQTVPDGDWCAGHWITGLHLAGLRTGQRALIDAALGLTETIRPKAERHDMFRAPKFYYSAARLHATEGKPELRALALDVANRMRAMAMPNGGMPIGNEVQVLTTTLSGPNVVAVDNVHPNLLLDWWAARETADDRFVVGAVRHLDLTARDFVRADGSTVEFIGYDPAAGMQRRHFTLLGAHDDSCWSRGQAWAIGGYLRAWEETREPRFLDTGLRLLDYYWDNSGDDHIPPWDFKDDAPLVDTSAAAIVAAQLARLAVLDPIPEAQPAIDRLEPLLAGLCRHLTPTHAGDDRPPGMLLDGCFNHLKGFAEAHELLWGGVYLLVALYCLEAGGLPC